MQQLGEYRVESFPSSRIATMDIGAVGRTKHHIAALIELDVTDARRLLAERKRDKQHLSFNSWLIKCISQAVDECKALHGIKQGKRKIVVFDDVDISIMIERTVDGKKVPLPYVIRKTNTKSITEIYDEIRAGQRQAIDDEGNYVLGEKKNALLMNAYYAMPGFLRRMVWRNILGNPFITKQQMGTVIVTSVGMMGKVTGWVLPVTVHPLSFAIGSIIKKPGVKDDRIEIREYLYMTITMDHDVIDGAPAMRAISTLTKLVETGYGLT